MGEQETANIEETKGSAMKIMTLTSYRRAGSRYGKDPMCRLCGNVIMVGQKYYSSKKKYRNKRYHWTCAERLNIV